MTRTPYRNYLQRSIHALSLRRGMRLSNKWSRNLTYL